MSLKQDNILSMGPAQQLELLKAQKNLLDTTSQRFKAGKIPAAKSTFDQLDLGAIEIISAQSQSQQIRNKATELKRRAATAARKLRESETGQRRRTAENIGLVSKGRLF